MSAKPNCPLETGLRPCECGMPRCPVCNYTVHDAAFEMDHGSCPGKIPEASKPSDSALYEQDMWTQGEDDAPPPADLAATENEVYREIHRPGGMIDRALQERAASMIAADLPWNPAKAKAHLRKWVSNLLQEVRDIREGLPDIAESEEEFRLYLAQRLGEAEWSVEWHAARAKGLSNEEAQAVADAAFPEERQ